MGNPSYCNHTRGPTINLRQCGSSVTRTIEAPLHLVWAHIQRFDTPQAYKRFVQKCTMQEGHGGVGSIRKVVVVSGLPDTTTIERLDKLDNELHVMQFTIVGGENRQKNYRSTVVLREVGDGRMTEVIESYEVDIPVDSNEEDTIVFADTIIGFNLKSLASLVETQSRNLDS